MIPHPNAICNAAEQNRQDLLAAAAHERRVGMACGRPLSWPPLLSRALALVALALGFRV